MVAAMHDRPHASRRQRLPQLRRARLARPTGPGTEAHEPTLDVGVTLLVAADLGQRPLAEHTPSGSSSTWRGVVRPRYSALLAW